MENMNDVPGTKEQSVYRIGGLCAMLGVLFGVIFAMLGPMNLDSHDMPSVLQTFATNANQLHLHGLGITLGTLLILGGFVAIHRSLIEGESASWGRMGLAIAIVMTVIHVLGAMMGGSVMPAVAESYMQASTDHVQTAMLIGKGYYILYEALLAPTFITLSVTVTLFAIAILRGKISPTLL